MTYIVQLLDHDMRLPYFVHFDGFIRYNFFKKYYGKSK